MLRGYIPNPLSVIPGKLLITCNIKQTNTTLNIAKRVLLINDDDESFVVI